MRDLAEARYRMLHDAATLALSFLSERERLMVIAIIGAMRIQILSVTISASAASALGNCGPGCTKKCLSG